VAGQSCAPGAIVGFDSSGNAICQCNTKSFTAIQTAVSDGAVIPVQIWPASGGPQSQATFGTGTCTVTVNLPAGRVDGAPDGLGWSIAATGSGYASCTQSVQIPNCSAPASVGRVDGGNYPACSSGALNLFTGAFSTANDVISCSP
jgi:hypothetical protein